jgi:hypothetical protein
MAVQLNSDKEAVKRPDLGPNDWIPHRDNVLAHETFSVKAVSDPKIDY